MSSRAPVPSVARRAAVAVAVLAAFYLTTIAIALALVPVPVIVFMAIDHVRPVAILAVAACCWIPAGLLLSGLFGVKPPRFSEPGLPLRREQAPAVFALLDELAAAAKTTAPADVYVSAMPELFVMETGGGLFGTNSRRVLCIGAPLLATSTVGELRSMLAHELGHYLGGDTRLSGVMAFTEGAFRSVLEATERNAFHDTGHWSIELAQSVAGGIGKGLVKLFASVYLRLTRPMKRRQELAADLLSAALAGRDTAIRALENVHVLGPLYHAYLASEVALVIDAGAMPTDLLAGFERFRARIAERGELAKLTDAVQKAETDPFDTHPALAERVAALRAAPDGRAGVLDANARTMLDGSFELDAWLVDATLTSFERSQARVEKMPWKEITNGVVPRRVAHRAREVAGLLHPRMPHATTVSAMFAAVVAGFESGRTAEIVAVAEPNVAQVPVYQQHEVIAELAGRLLLVLFEGALVEGGAEIEESLGEPCLVFRFAGDTVRPGSIAIGAMRDDAGRHELARWTARLATPPDGMPLAVHPSQTAG